MRPMPLLCRVTPSAVGLVMGLSLGMELRVVVLLLVLMRWVHVGVGLGVLLAWHVVGVGSPSLLLIGGVASRIVEGVNGLVVIWVVSRRRHGSGHVCLAVVWMVPHAIWTHGSICLDLGLWRHGWIVSRCWPSLSLHTWVTAHQRGLMVIGAKSLVFINTILRPRFHCGVLWRNGSALCVWSTCRLTRSLISMVCWARVRG